MLKITPKNLLLFSECSYKSRQPKGGPAPFASFEDLSDYLGEEISPNQLHIVEWKNTDRQIFIFFTAEDTSPEEIVPLPGIYYKFPLMKTK